jgi:hypothetical protein
MYLRPEVKYDSLARSALELELKLHRDHRSERARDFKRSFRYTGTLDCILTSFTLPSPVRQKSSRGDQLSS